MEEEFYDNLPKIPEEDLTESFFNTPKTQEQRFNSPDSAAVTGITQMITRAFEQSGLHISDADQQRITELIQNVVAAEAQTLAPEHFDTQVSQEEAHRTLQSFASPEQTDLARTLEEDLSNSPQAYSGETPNHLDANAPYTPTGLYPGENDPIDQQTLDNEWSALNDEIDEPEQLAEEQGQQDPEVSPESTDETQEGEPSEPTEESTNSPEAPLQPGEEPYNPFPLHEPAQQNQFGPNAQQQTTPGAPPSTPTQSQTGQPDPQFEEQPSEGIAARQAQSKQSTPQSNQERFKNLFEKRKRTIDGATDRKIKPIEKTLRALKRAIQAAKALEISLKASLAAERAGAWSILIFLYICDGILAIASIFVVTAAFTAPAASAVTSAIAYIHEAHAATVKALKATIHKVKTGQLKLEKIYNEGQQMIQKIQRTRNGLLARAREELISRANTPRSQDR
jgi:hypothetical protein